MSVRLIDSVALEGVRVTKDGYLVADARVARTGIYLYAGSELDRPDMEMVRVYRPEDEVFSERAMASFTHRPITVDHPPEQVSASNWKKYAVGFTSGDIARDGAFLRVPLTLMDADAIQAVQDGKNELSCGYTCDIEWTAGQTPEGEAYDAVMKSISGNHIAAVGRGRAGPECRIGDDAQQRQADGHKPTSQPQQTEAPLRAILIDGISVEFSPQGAEAVTKLQAQLADAQKNTETAIQRVQDAEKAHKAAIDSLEGQIAGLKAANAKALEAKDGEIAGLNAAHEQAVQALKGEIDALRAQTSDEAMEARVAARAALVAQAKRVLGDAFDPAGKTDAEIRKAAVVKLLGNKLADADSKGDEYFRAAFDTLVLVAPAAAAPARPDPLRQVIAAGGGTPTADAADPLVAEKQALARMVARDVNAWKNPAKEVA